MKWIKENWLKIIATILAVGLVFLVLGVLDKNAENKHYQLIDDLCSFLDENSAEYGRCVDNATDVLQSMSLDDV